MAALIMEMMRGGTSPGKCQAMNGGVATAVSAAGTVITDATDLTSTTNYVSTVAASSGVQLPRLIAGESIKVYNAQSANVLKVYPGASTVAINQIAAGGAHSLPPYTMAEYTGISVTQVIATQSA